MKVFIVEDHAMFRDVLIKVCTSELNFEMVGAAANCRGAIAGIASTHPDLVLLDISLPDGNAFAVIDEIGRFDYKPDFIIVSCHCDSFTISEVQRWNVRGFIDKTNCVIQTLNEALHIVASGGTYFSETFQKVFLANITDRNNLSRLLSRREIEILGGIGLGLNNVHIADNLKISINTARVHRANISRKLGLHSAAELAVYAIQNGVTVTTQMQKIAI